LTNILLEKPILLLVEGRDEEIFFKYFIPHLIKTDENTWNNLDSIQVLPFNGTSKLSEILELIKLVAGYEAVTQIGIIRDADNDAISAFQAVQNALKIADLPIPESQLVPTQLKPVINAMIIPETGNGSFEKIFLNSVVDDPASNYVDEYFSNLNQHYNDGNLDRPINMCKAKIHAFLASRKKPIASFGGGAIEKYWDYDNESFNDLKAFLMSLISDINTN